MCSQVEGMMAVRVKSPSLFLSPAKGGEETGVGPPLKVF